MFPEIRPLSEKAKPPSLIQYNQFGKRIDVLDTSESWRGLKAIVQEEGLVSIQYERKEGEYSRIYSFAKQLLMIGDAQVVRRGLDGSVGFTSWSMQVLCPFSMTDGAARVLELQGNRNMKENVFKRLIRYLYFRFHPVVYLGAYCH